MSFETECDKYRPGENGKTCVFFDPSGACKNPEEFMCVVWLKRRGQYIPPKEGDASELKPSGGGPVVATAPVGEAARSSQTTLAGVGVNAPSSVAPKGRSAAGGVGGGVGAQKVDVAKGERSDRTDAERLFSMAPEKRSCGCADLPTGYKLEDIASVKQRGLEICVETEACGELWFVPEVDRTSNRKELSFENLATIVGISIAFPGSKVRELRFKESSK